METEQQRALKVVAWIMAIIILVALIVLGVNWIRLDTSLRELEAENSAMATQISEFQLAMTPTPEVSPFTKEDLEELAAIIERALGATSIPRSCTRVGANGGNRLDVLRFGSEDWIMWSSQAYSYMDDQGTYCGSAIVVIYPDIDAAKIAYWRFVADYDQRVSFVPGERDDFYRAEGERCSDDSDCTGVSVALVTEKYLGEDLNIVIMDEFQDQGAITVVNPETGESIYVRSYALNDAMAYHDSLLEPLTEALIEWAGQR